jgi:putative glutamine amidotransferase
VPTGWALPDGSVEAVEDPGRTFALGVMWHPEQDEASRVLAALIEAARASAERRSARPRAAA